MNLLTARKTNSVTEKLVHSINISSLIKFQLQFGNVFGMLSGSEKGVLVLGLVNLFLLLLEIPFLYYVIKITSSFFNSTLHETEAVTDEPRSQIYSLLLVLLLLFTLVLFASSLTFTVFGFKVFRKMLYLSSELALIIPMRQSKEKVVQPIMTSRNASLSNRIIESEI